VAAEGGTGSKRNERSGVSTKKSTKREESTIARGRTSPSLERSPIARSSIVGRIGSIERDRERLPRRCFERTAPRRPRHLRAPTFTPGRRRSSIKVPNQSYISCTYLRFIPRRFIHAPSRSDLARARAYDDRCYSPARFSRSRVIFTYRTAPHRTAPRRAASPRNA